MTLQRVEEAVDFRFFGWQVERGEGGEGAGGVLGTGEDGAGLGGVDGVQEGDEIAADEGALGVWWKVVVYSDESA